MALFQREKAPPEENLPRHIGIIMDGNGRWARRRGMPRSAGHKKGADVFRTIVQHCVNLHIKYVTFYCFSCENWKRPKEEVENLMNMFRDFLLEAEAKQDENQNVRIHFIGEREGLSSDLLELMDRMEEASRDCYGTTVNMAINYGGRQEIVRAVKKIAADVEFQNLRVEDITTAEVEKYLYTAGQDEPDLIIRPSGEQRLSNFLVWQSAYAEFWYSDVLWPDFKERDLNRALHADATRNRRFGG
ncbi:MAG: isoprenyl transferase [Clostridiales bacterium]|nr:isoprenyl transferase [Clostridiales bacterium]